MVIVRATGLSLGLIGVRMEIKRNSGDNADKPIQIQTAFCL